MPTPASPPRATRGPLASQAAALAQSERRTSAPAPRTQARAEAQQPAGTAQEQTFHFRGASAPTSFSNVDRADTTLRAPHARKRRHAHIRATAAARSGGGVGGQHTPNAHQVWYNARQKFCGRHLDPTSFCRRAHGEYDPDDSMQTPPPAPAFVMITTSPRFRASDRSPITASSSVASCVGHAQPRARVGMGARVHSGRPGARARIRIWLRATAHAYYAHRQARTRTCACARAGNTRGSSRRRFDAASHVDARSVSSQSSTHIVCSFARAGPRLTPGSTIRGAGAAVAAAATGPPPPPPPPPQPPAPTAAVGSGARPAPAAPRVTGGPARVTHVTLCCLD